MRGWVLGLLVACGGGDDGDDGGPTGVQPTDEPRPTDEATDGRNPTDPGGHTDPPDPEAVGMRRRPAQGSCVAPAPLAEPTASGARLSPMFPDVQTGGATMVVQHPTDDDLFFVIRQGLHFQGDDARSLQVIERSGGRWRASTAHTFTDVLTSYRDGGDDVTVWEGGILGLAVHPDFGSGTREVFVHYTRPYSGAKPGFPFESAVVRMTLDASHEVVPGSIEDVVVLPQPAPHHQAGHLMFGQDGMLYVAFGDGGAGNEQAAQDPSDFHGAILRLDVDGPAPYRVPADNPLVGNRSGHREEIYAWGLRNPWKLDQDPLTGRILVADVGQFDWEEINELQAGANYGWPDAHGPDCLVGRCAGMREPLLSLRHQSNGGDFKALIGGAFHGDTSQPSWVGRYFFANQRSPTRLYMLSEPPGGEPRAELIDDGSLGAVMGLVGLRDGRVVVMAQDQVWLLSPEDAEPPAEGNFPMTLQTTGCFDGAEPGEGLIPYELRVALWSDGAGKRRWMVVPDGEKLSVGPSGDVRFPRGSLLFKEFSLRGRRLETRMLVHHEDGTWRGYTYRWNPAGTRADLLRSGLVATEEGQRWLYPSGAQCLGCHQKGLDWALGPDIRNLDRTRTWKGGVVAGQLETYAHIGLFDGSLPSDLLAFPGLSQDTEGAVRAYMHANCAGCHNPQGTDRTALDLRFETPLDQTGLCDGTPLAGTLGIAGARIVAPGDPERSVLLKRVQSTDPAVRMPPMGTAEVHGAWVELLEDWIRGGGCR